MTKSNRLLGILALVLSSGLSAQAQGLGRDSIPPGNMKTVEVSREFEPTVEAAEKVHFLPPLDDSVPPAPKFTYDLYPHPVHTHFPLQLLPAARMGREPLDKISPFLFRVGMGTRGAPLLEAYYSGPRGDRMTYGVGLSHRSLWGQVSLDDGTREAGKKSETRISAALDASWRRVGLHADLWYAHRYHNFYGRRDTTTSQHDSLYLSTVSAHSFGATLRCTSLDLDSSALWYDGRLDFRAYLDSHEQRESLLSFQLKGYKFFRSERFGWDLRAEHLFRDLRPSVGGNTLLDLSPWIEFFGERWRVRVGAGLSLDANNGHNFFHLFPRAHLSYDIVKHYVIPYVEVDGGVDPVRYEGLRRENPWVVPGLFVWNSTRRMAIQGGVRGNLSSRSSYHFAGAYALVDSLHFFVNQRVTDPATGQDLGPGASFGVVYDNVRVLRLTAELDYHIGLKLRMSLRGDYWRYGLQDLPEAWHKPMFQATLHASYRLSRKIYAGLNFFVVGGARALGEGDEVIALGVYPDLNLNLHYAFNERFALFAELDNLLFQRYRPFYLYPQHGFNLLLGARYMF